MERVGFQLRSVGNSRGAHLFVVGSLFVAVLSGLHAWASDPAVVFEGASGESSDLVEGNDGESVPSLSARVLPIPAGDRHSDGGEVLHEHPGGMGETAPSEDHSLNYFAFPPSVISARDKASSYSAAAEEHVLSEQLSPRLQVPGSAKRRKATVRVSEAPVVVHSVEKDASWRQTPTVRALLTTARLSTAKVSRWLQQRGGSYYNALKHRRELSVLALAIVILAVCIVRQEMRLHAYQAELETQENNLEMLKRVEADNEAERRSFVRYIEKYEFSKEQLKQKEQEIAHREAELESNMQDAESLKEKDSKEDVDLLLREDRVFQAGPPLRQMKAAFVEILNLLQSQYGYSPEEMVAELRATGLLDSAGREGPQDN